MNNIVIERYPDKLVFVNPGTMLISVEQFFAGGTSICRNFGLQKMFSLKEPAVGLIPSPRDGKRTQTAGDVYLPKANTEGGAAGTIGAEPLGMLAHKRPSPQNPSRHIRNTLLLSLHSHIKVFKIT